MGEKDIISKQIVRHLAVDLATYLLKLDIGADSLELLETERQRVEDRRADLVARVRPRGSDELFILHILATGSRALSLGIFSSVCRCC